MPSHIFYNTRARVDIDWVLGKAWKAFFNCRKKKKIFFPIPKMPCRSLARINSYKDLVYQMFGIYKGFSLPIT